MIWCWAARAHRYGQLNPTHPSCLCGPLVQVIHGRPSLCTAPKIDNLMVRSGFQTDPSLAFHSPDAFRGRRTAIRKPQEGDKGSKSVIGYLFFCRSFGIWFDLIWVDSRGRGIGFSLIPSFVVFRVALFMMPCCSSSLGSRIRSWLRDYDCLQSVAVVLIYVQVSNSGSLGFLGSNNRWLCIVYFDLCSCDLVGCFVGFWWMLLGLDVGLFEVSIYIRFSLFVTNWFNWLFTGWR